MQEPSKVAANLGSLETIPFDSQVRALLSACGLPVADLPDNDAVRLFGQHRQGELTGVVGVEVRAKLGLLRSLAVAPEHRGSGLGQALVEHAEAWASRRELEAIYLLTTTASGFFVRLGYQEISRAETPAAIRASAEFSELCPSTAIVMRKELPVDPDQGPKRSLKSPLTGKRN